MVNFLTLRRPAADTTITWKNIVTDYGATPGGSGDSNGDLEAFQAFNTWGREQTGWVGLVLPPTPGSHYGTSGSYGTNALNAPFAGIKKLIVMGHGAAVNAIHGGALLNNNLGRALIHTVEKGSTSIQLKDVEDAGKYTVGKIIFIAGLDLQGGWGYPPNSQYFEFPRIEAIDGDTITLDRPLRNTYRDDWPYYFEGNSNEIGGFGRASISTTIDGWDAEHWIFGLKSVQSGQTYYFYRKVRLRDVKNDNQGWIIGASDDMRIIGQQHTASLHEVDKLTTYAVVGEYDGPGRNLSIQSSSVDFMHVRGGNRPIAGSTKRMLITGGNRTAIALGPIYGNTEHVDIRDAVVTGSITAGVASHRLTFGDDFSYDGDGVFRLSNAGHDQVLTLVPGAAYVIQTKGLVHHHSPFRITGLTRDSETNDILIATTLEGETLPAVDGVENNHIVRLNAPSLTVIDCTGCADAEELSLVPPGSPYGIFKRRTYDGLTATGHLGFLMGRLVHMKINVTQPYTGSAAPNLGLRYGQFNANVLNADMTAAQPVVSFNLKAAGERIITPEGVTGQQTGDSGLSNLTGGVWLPQNFGHSFFIGNGNSAVNLSGESASVRPIVTVEILTDQEIPAAA